MKEKLFDRFFNLLDEASDLLDLYEYCELLNDCRKRSMVVLVL